MTKDDKKDSHYSLPITDDQPVIGNEDMSNEGVAEDYKNRWLRAVADYQNLVKDTAKEREQWVKFSNQELIMELLPIVNHFHQAAKHVPADQQTEAWVVGLFHVLKQFEDLLANLGVEPISAAGPFDPAIHDAVDHQPSADHNEDEIIKEVTPGYTWHGKVIMPSRVVVAAANKANH